VHRRSGWLVQRRTPEALAERLVFVLQNPKWAKLAGQFAVQHVHNNFSLNVATYTLEELCRKTASREKQVHHLLYQNNL